MITMDKELAKACALDAGDRHRRANGRVNQPWNEDDWNVASDEYNRLIKLIEEPVQ